MPEDDPGFLKRLETRGSISWNCRCICYLLWQKNITMHSEANTANNAAYFQKFEIK